ncbi:MAG: DUF3866 family protein, partial [Armatimonadetes bacterium]|nr:DUF3866 family protein [Armatimonadota bacterium]
MLRRAKGSASCSRPARERRRRPRLEPPVPFRLCGLPGVVHDVSRGGLSLHLPGPIAPQTVLELGLVDAHGHRCAFTARVVWCEKRSPCRAGLEFVNLTARQDAWLALRFLGWLAPAEEEEPVAASPERTRSLLLRQGVLLERLASRPGAEEWLAELEGGQRVAAVHYSSLCGPLHAGQAVLLNLTALALDLGTGGRAFVVGPLCPELDDYPGREAGHQIKLRYTPLQHRVRTVEDPASPHRDALVACAELGGVPVVCAELHSQMAAAALAARATCPDLQLVYLMTDGAALPIAWSRLVAVLKSAGVLAATITTGQAFGGDYEAVSLPSALIAARAVAGADVILVSQGPGNAGTGTTFGFSGTQQAEALHAAAALGGQPVAVLRASDADPRPRHQGISHHSLTLLGRLTLCTCTVPLPAGEDARRLRTSLAEAGIIRHTLAEVAVEA